ncbi:hypothetical protein [Actinoallomurus sp. CA-142502]|uniref:hypothetical protein n=1 Tax=Actinoallomurus sp. CA-142502 TaxID=3239885 RepID=UPI003D8EA9D2
MSALVPLSTVTFHDGQKLHADLPRNTLDPRYPLCTNHRFACLCREAETAEDRQEWRAELEHARKVFAEVLAGHPTYTDDGRNQCLCTGCQVARATYGQFRSYSDIRRERKAAARRQQERDVEIDRLHGEITKLRARLRGRSGEASIDILRDAVQTEGGNWTVHRASHALPGRWIAPERLRTLLNQLADEGLLIKHGKLGRLWTPVGGGDA